MPRIRDIESAPLDPAQRTVFDRIAGGPRGRVEGPLRIWLHSPALAERSQALGAFCRYDSSLPPRLSELAIITIGAYWRAGFEWHIHAPIAEDAGIARATIAAIKAGDDPHLLPEDERIVFDFTRALIVTRRVPTDVFQAAEAAFGTRGVVDLVGVIGYYSYIAMTITAFEVETPGGDPFD